MILRDVLGNKIHPMTNLKISLCGGLDNILRLIYDVFRYLDYYNRKAHFKDKSLKSFWQVPFLPFIWNGCTLQISS